MDGWAPDDRGTLRRRSNVDNPVQTKPQHLVVIVNRTTSVATEDARKVSALKPSTTLKRSAVRSIHHHDHGPWLGCFNVNPNARTKDVSERAITANHPNNGTDSIISMGRPTMFDGKRGEQEPVRRARKASEAYRHLRSKLPRLDPCKQGRVKGGETSVGERGRGACAKQICQGGARRQLRRGEQDSARSHVRYDIEPTSARKDRGWSRTKTQPRFINSNPRCIGGHVKTLSEGAASGQRRSRGSASGQ